VIQNGQPGPLTLASVHEAFVRWLAFPTDAKGRPCCDLVDVALAVVIANRMDADPLWLFLVAPPSSGKTEMIRALGDVTDASKRLRRPAGRPRRPRGVGDRWIGSLRRPLGSR
jgi:hypothetical protein